MLRQLCILNTLRGLHRLLAPVACSKYFFPYGTTVEGRPSIATNSTNPPMRDPGSFATKNAQDVDGNSSSSNLDCHGESGNDIGSTYIEEEVAKFRAMANSWWDPDGDCKPLHSLNELRVSMIREGLVQSNIAKPGHIEGPQPLTGLKILDVGCGGGILCEPLARLGARVVGLDAAEENISVAILHADEDPRVQQNVEYMCGTIEGHAEIADEKYDAVIASEVLEHVDAIDLFINTCADIVKPGGSFFITTINKTTTAWVGAIAVAEYALRLLPPGTHDWNKFIPRQELLFMLEKSGFVTRMVHGMSYNALVNKWFWVSNTSVNYGVHAIKESDRW